MIRMLGPARPLLAAGFALLCLALALGYAIAQSTPAAPAIDSVHSGDTTLTVFVVRSGRRDRHHGLRRAPHQDQRG